MDTGKAINSKTEMTHGWIERLQSRHISQNIGALEALRSKVLFYIILFFCILAGLAYIPSVYAAYINRLHDIVIIDTVVRRLFSCFLNRISAIRSGL